MKILFNFSAKNKIFCDFYKNTSYILHKNSEFLYKTYNNFKFYLTKYINFKLDKYTCLLGAFICSLKEDGKKKINKLNLSKYI